MRVGSGRQDDDLLDADTVVGYLAERGLLRTPESATAVALGGGVSNVVLSVTDCSTGMIVKQSLPRLRVRDEWLAPRNRVLTEADALDLAATLTPGAVPRVHDRDADRHVIVLERAASGWLDWKSRLMTGDVDPRIAERLGLVLAKWHADTTTARLPERCYDTTAFEQLRVDAYYRTVATRVPDTAAALQTYIDAMAGRRRCLVHGDFSPKNVLVGDDGLWVIDFEVAHLGDPAFDLAFLLCHLTLKAIHLPAVTEAFDESARRFAGSYQDAVPKTLRPDWSYVLGHVGCMLLARVDGKSPAEYLTEPERRRTASLGRSLLADPPDHVADLHELRDTLRS